MENLLDKETVKRVQEYITKFNSELKIIVLNTTARTAQDAANSLKCEVGAIVKSLLFKADNNILIDKSLNRFDYVYAAAGHPNCVFKIDYNQLTKITKGAEIDISE